jgi:hypothetical protein
MLPALTLSDYGRDSIVERCQSNLDSNVSLSLSHCVNCMNFTIIVFLFL